MPVDFPKLHESSVAELRTQAQELGLDQVEHALRADLAFLIGHARGDREQINYGRGVLEIHGEGFGFLRSVRNNFLPGAGDIYVSQSQIRRFSLQTGDTVIGQVRPPKEGERYPALLRVESVNGEQPGVERDSFESLTAIYPDDRIPLQDDAYLRVVDLAAPIGLGQRGLLVAPSRTGREDLLRRLATQLTRDDDLHVTVLLVGERPEEIHEWRQATRAEIIATPFDEQPARHVQVAEMVFERARRMVERGDDAVLLVDSFTRLLRYCLADMTPSGRSIGSVDAAALQRMRQCLGAARALEEGGSLTVIGVVSSCPDNPVDRTLEEDLRDVVNWELSLSRALADRGIHPAVDIHRSGTRRADRLLDDEEQRQRAEWSSKLTGDLIDDAQMLATLATSAPGLDSIASTGN